MFKVAGAALEVLVRAIVRDELRAHLGPEGDYLMNVRQAPMSHQKLRRLVALGEIQGFRHGRETFIRASDFRTYVERRPVERQRIAVPEPKIDEAEDRRDEVRVAVGLQFADPKQQRAFELRLAGRRAGGGERAASLVRAEQQHRELLLKEKERQERVQRRRGEPIRNRRA